MGNYNSGELFGGGGMNRGNTEYSRHPTEGVAYAFTIWAWLIDSLEHSHAYILAAVHSVWIHLQIISSGRMAKKMCPCEEDAFRCLMTR